MSSKAHGNKAQTIFTYKKIYQAYLDCRTNKRKTINSLKFEYELEKNLANLIVRLRNGTYKPDRSTCFVVTDPTIREIFAADFKDRIIHHLFVSELSGITENFFCFDSYACRKGKGTHAAVERLKNFLPKATNNYTRQAYCLQLDISSFFMSIDHNILFGLVKKRIDKSTRESLWKNEMLWLAKVIIYTKATDNYIVKGEKQNFALLPKGKSLFEVGKFKGLPIGNLTSQFFANLYMNELDQYIKRSLKCRFYVRYVDDFMILSNSKTDLEKVIVGIDNFLRQKLKLSLNYKKTKLKNIHQGIDFLGYYIKPDYVLARKKVVKRFWSKIRLIQSTQPVDKNRLRELTASYFGHFGHANSYFLRKKFEQVIEQINKVKIS